MRVSKPSFAAVVACAIATLFAGSSLAQTPASQPLTVGLKCSSRPLPVDSAMVCRVRLQNTHPARPIVLRGTPGFSAAGGLKLRITNEQGVLQLAPPEAGETTLDDARQGLKFVQLAAGQAIVLTKVVPVADLFPAPGFYEVDVLWNNPAPGLGGRADQALEVGSTTSNAVLVEVAN